MKVKIFYFIFVFFLTAFYSEAGTVDSLYLKIKTGKNDTVKAKARYSLIDYYVNTTNQYTLAMVHCDTLADFCKQKKFYKLQCTAMLNHAYCDEYLGNYDLSIKTDSSVLLIAKKNDLEKMFANALSNMGNNFSHKGNYSKALDCYLIALKSHESRKDSLSVAMLYHNTAIIYRLNKQPKKALEFFRKAAAIREKKKNFGLASTYCSIGNYFIENEKSYDSAIVYYFKALKIAKENKDIQTEGLIKANLGNVYLQKKDYKNSEKFLKENLEIYESMNEKSGMSYANNALASLYGELGKKSLAMEHAKKALQLSEEIKNPEDMKAAYKTIAQLSEMFNDFKTAFKYQALEMKMNDSLYNEAGSKAMAEMSHKYEAEKKQQEIKLLTETGLNQKLELNNSRLLVYGVLIVLALLSVVAFALVRNNRIKQSANNLLTSQKHIIEEKNGEILDSIKYAQRIQNTILPPQELIKKYLPDSFIYYLPKDIVSGDFYYFQVVNETKGAHEILIAAVDCTGHGVPGAMVSVIGFNAMNRAIKEFKITEPGKVLDKVREIVLETFGTSEIGVKDGMDMSLLKIKLTESPELEWAGANNPLWIVSTNANEVEEYKPNKQPIGQTDLPEPFTTHSIKINKGDAVYIFTDGYADQFGGERGKKLKSSNMKKLLLEMHHEKMEHQKEKIHSEFETWRAKLDQVDDICVMGIRL